MTSEEIADAMKHRIPVECDGIKYDYIKEYVLWYDDKGKRKTSCGLIETRKMTDGNGREADVHTIVRVQADKVVKCV